MLSAASLSLSVFSWIIHQCHHVDLFLVRAGAMCVCVCLNQHHSCMCVRAKQRSPHAVLACNLCHWLEFDGWAASHNTVSQGWGVCVCIFVPRPHDFVCLHLEMWTCENCDGVHLHPCLCVCVCAPARMNSGAALCFCCLHWHGVTVRSLEETSEAAAVRRSQLPLVTLVSSNLEEINSEP